jgi:hypothetical protein
LFFVLNIFCLKEVNFLPEREGEPEGHLASIHPNSDESQEHTRLLSEAS